MPASVFASGVFAAVIVATAIGWLLVVLRRKALKQRIFNSMSPEERTHHDTIAAHLSAIRSATARVAAATKTRSARLRFAQRRLARAENSGHQTVGRYSGRGGTVTAYQHKIVTPRGSFPMDISVLATVDAAGTLATSQRPTLTRMAAGARLLQPAFADTRELFLMVEGTGFGYVIGCVQETGPKVRQFAMAVNAAATGAESVARKRNERVAIARAETEAGQLDRGELDEAQNLLERVTADTSAIDAASARLVDGNGAKRH